jgi:hypothetical protein
VTRSKRRRRCSPNRARTSNPRSRFCTCLPAEVARLERLKGKIDAQVQATDEPDKALLARQKLAEPKTIMDL